eukprot:351134-Chlamydomonas_euryale.AAC.4
MPVVTTHALALQRMTATTAPDMSQVLATQQPLAAATARRRRLLAVVPRHRRQCAPAAADVIPNVAALPAGLVAMQHWHHARHQVFDARSRGDRHCSVGLPALYESLCEHRRVDAGAAARQRELLDAARVFGVADSMLLHHELPLELLLHECGVRLVWRRRHAQQRRPAAAAAVTVSRRPHPQVCLCAHRHRRGRLFHGEGVLVRCDHRLLPLPPADVQQQQHAGTGQVVHACTCSRIKCL